MVLRSTLEQNGNYDTWGDYIPKEHQSAIKTSSKSHSVLIKTCWLNHYSALKIYGPDAERFLQGQLTCNVTDMKNVATRNTAHYGACCTAKGRVVANFNISFDGQHYWLVLPTKSADILDKHLQKYKVFFKATIENCQHSHLIFGQWQNTKTAAATEIENNHEHTQRLIISDNRQLLIIEDAATEDHSTSLDPTYLVPSLDWQLANIADGIYFVDNDQHELWIPQHINWHKLEGISFNKGCYTGQEIIARLQYLGKAKKALYYYSYSAETKSEAFEQQSNQLFDKQGKSQGDIVFQRDGEILAVLNGENPDSCLYLNDSQKFSLTMQNLPYTDKKDA